MIKLGWVWVPVLYASIGDRQPDYRKCYSVCLKTSGTGLIICRFRTSLKTSPSQKDSKLPFEIHQSGLTCHYQRGIIGANHVSAIVNFVSFREA